VDGIVNPLNLLPENQSVYRPYVDLSFWVALGILLMLFLAYSPSTDDVIRGIVMGAVVAVWGQVTAKIAEMNAKKQERTSTAEYLSRSLSERKGETIDDDTISTLTCEVENRPSGPSDLWRG
jgi:hypothetical protein